jgi:hypothetical protein
MLQTSTDTISSWFNYIRENPEDKRFLECFWDTQLASKERVLQLYPEFFHSGPCYVFGGWYGLLPHLLLDNKYVKKVYSIDIDPECERAGNVYFRKEHLQYITGDMKDFVYPEKPDVVINTSTEHVDQETFDIWYENIPRRTFIIMQGNDLVIPEHVRPFKNLEEFLTLNRSPVNHCDEMELPGPNNTTYKRFTMTGFKE